VFYVRDKGKITNEEKGIFNRVGITGKGVYYVLEGQQRGGKGVLFTQDLCRIFTSLSVFF